ncbi:prepilin peptidase [Novosphingobium sp. ZN18A2]|uniref:prepilin peptidase n=1 Tax=Novosphingobium sp. ZN18A2 TaxID=3079861 RepID=UPI0030D41BFD
MLQTDTLWLVPQWVMIAGGGILGALMGSFIGAALVRMPQGASVVFGRSRCDSCGKVLAPVELVPIVSFVLSRGKCRACGASIDRWQTGAEVAGLLIGALPWIFAEDALVALCAMLMGWQLLLLGLLDLKHLWLPMRLVGALALSGIVAVAGLGWAGDMHARLFASLTGGVLGWGILAAVSFAYRRTRGVEGMGRGDPPLLGAIGLWLGPLGVVEVLLGASIAGILAAVAMMAMKREVAGDTVLPLGSLLACAAWPLFVLQGFG